MKYLDFQNELRITTAHSLIHERHAELKPQFLLTSGTVRRNIFWLIRLFAIGFTNGTITTHFQGASLRGSVSSNAYCSL